MYLMVFGPIDRLSGVSETLRASNHSHLKLKVSRVSKKVDDRSPTAKAMSKASDIMVISMMMILPGLIGYVIDQRLGTRMLFLLLGFVFGMGGSFYLLIRLVSASDDSPSAGSSNGGDSEQA